MNPAKYIKSVKAAEVFAAVVVLAVIGLAVLGNIRNPLSKEGLLSLRANGALAYGNGYTDARSVGYAKRFFSNNPDVDTFVLQRMSGTQDADMNLRIARGIRARGLSTHLQSDSFIASGAVDLFLAGTQRTIDCGAKIGVHSWSTGLYDAQDAVYDDRKNRQERFLRDMGIDPSFYVFTRDAAPADGLHVLTDNEIRRFGLSTEPHDCPA